MLGRSLTLIIVLSGLLGFSTQGLSRENPIDATDSTWPLRLAGDSTWPLRFAGGSIDLSPTPGGTTVRTDMTIKFINKRVMLPVSARKLKCKNTGPTLQKHEASGTVVVGNELLKIVGICYTKATDSIEVISEKSGGLSSISSSLTGRIPSKTVSKLRGHLNLNRSSGNQTFRFTIQCDKRVKPPIDTEIEIVDRR